jgi:hypothetical protein
MVANPARQVAAGLEAGGGDDPLAEALARRNVLGTREFFVSPGHMIRILRAALSRPPRPRLSLNRPQVGGASMVHRLEWQELVFTCVTRRPLTVA